MEPTKQPKLEQPTQPKAEQPKPEQAKLEQAQAQAQPQVEQPKHESPVLDPAVLSTPAAQNAIKLAGEALLPGASLLMEGKILHGGVHLLAGALAKAFLGPVGIAVVIANSYSNSTTGKNLLEQFSRFVPTKTE